MGRVVRRDRPDDRRSDETGEYSSEGSASGIGSRGQVHVLGMVLLVGAVAVASVGIVLLGSTALDTRETAVETERAEESLLEFTHAAETAAVTGQRSSSVSLGPFDHGSVETTPDDGRVRVTHVTDSEAVLYDASLGTVAYVDGDTEIAYQGGGLWRREGNGTVLLSDPAVDYRDGTLTIPVVRVTGDGVQGRSIDASVTRSRSPTRIDLPDHDAARGHATGDLRIEIESAYCDGWERELEATVPGSVVERCSDGQPGRVRIELAVPRTIDPVDSAVVAHEIDIHRNAPPIEGDVRTGAVDEDRVNGSVIDAGYEYPSVDGRVAELVDRCEDQGFEDLPDEVTEPGRYCVDSIDDAHTFDTAAGDIEVVVRDSIGDPNYRDELRFEGENDLTIYVDGDLSARGNAVIGNESDPSRTRLLFSADGTATTANGDPTIAALLYAPDSTVSLQGNPTIDGSIVAERVEIDNIEPGVVRYDDRIAGVGLAPGPGPRLRYLDATAYELSIDD
ncbi:DUF7289 family protein [Halosolutus halophilus]|uniref:DUF7289 family protein n=1 Tax=Halosolutus halophilus TaxID=1552990 RepID=UPI0022352FF0|nr:hypothetical protein [Halosolutus halophilus]